MSPESFERATGPERKTSRFTVPNAVRAAFASLYVLMGAAAAKGEEIHSQFPIEHGAEAPVMKFDDQNFSADTKFVAGTYELKDTDYEDADALYTQGEWKLIDEWLAGRSSDLLTARHTLARSIKGLLASATTLADPVMMDEDRVRAIGNELDRILQAEKMISKSFTTWPDPPEIDELEKIDDEVLKKAQAEFEELIAQVKAMNNKTTLSALHEISERSRRKYTGRRP